MVFVTEIPFVSKCCVYHDGYRDGLDSRYSVSCSHVDTTVDSPAVFRYDAAGFGRRPHEPHSRGFMLPLTIRRTGHVSQ